MQKKVQRAQIRQLESFNVTGDHVLEMLFHALSRNFARKQRKPFRFERDQPDIRRIALVAGTGVCELYELYFHMAQSLHDINGRRQTTGPVRVDRP